ncbi:MAG TPA: hypothetical protein VHW09_16715 [Bryobacteraceae bacterium]|jgi:hypothetical protein|nr:hypothetical protein [Bryobacteraceae bacterium]
MAGAVYPAVPAAGRRAPGRFPVAVALGCFSFLLLTYALPAPALPVAEVEQGWQQVLSAAFLRHAQFGPDIFFPYGPWGFLTEPLGDPRIYPWLVFARGFIALAVSLALGWQLTALRSNLLKLLVLALVLPMANPAGILLLLFILIRSRTEPAPAWLECLAVTACALCAHTKLSLGFLFFALILYLLFDEVSRLRRWPWLTGVAAAAYLGWYCVAGQHLGFLVEYLSSSLPVLLGYGGAMGLPPSKAFPLAAVMGCLGALGLWLANAVKRRQIAKVSATVWIAIFLFVGLKQAFGRSDIIHLWLGLFNLVLPGLILLAAELALDYPRRARIGVVCAASFSLLALGYSSLHGNTEPQVRALAAGKNLARAFENMIHPGLLNAEYRSRMGEIRRSCSLPELSGTVDVFESLLACGLVNDDRFRWRPMFLLSSGYTAGISRRNAEFLRSPKAAQNMLFGILPTDDRYPPLEDSLSWLAMLQNYRPDASAGDDILFTRTTPRDISLVPLLKRTARMGEPVSIPPVVEPVWAEISVDISAAGKIAGLLLAAPPVSLQLTAGGQRRDFRFLAGTARAGFLLSPLIVTPPSFASLYPEGPFSSVHPPRVESLALVSSPRYYRQDFTVRLYRLVHR